jgi:hypothetical protein
MDYHLKPKEPGESHAEERLTLETTPAAMVGILRSMIDTYQFLAGLQAELPPSAREWGELPLQLQRLRYAIGQLMVLARMELEIESPPRHKPEKAA